MPPSVEFIIEQNFYLTYFGHANFVGRQQEEGQASSQMQMRRFCTIGLVCKRMREGIQWSHAILLDLGNLIL